MCNIDNNNDDDGDDDSEMISITARSAFKISSFFLCAFKIVRTQKGAACKWAGVPPRDSSEIPLAIRASLVLAPRKRQRLSGAGAVHRICVA